MAIIRVLCVFSVILIGFCKGQIIQFGQCPDVATVEYFQLDKFLGEWHEIQRFSSWFEYNGHCASKTIRQCGKKIAVEHIYVRDGIQFVLHVNSTYSSGDEAVFYFNQTSIDPVGIPLLVISTDYDNYAVIYGCKYEESQNIRYNSAWILSRYKKLPEKHLEEARSTLNAIPGVSTAYLETVSHDEAKCSYYWTAHVEAEIINSSQEFEELARRVK